MTNSEGKSVAAWSAADLGTFFLSHRSEFLAYARRLVAATPEAEEIVQDSLVRVLLACPELESEEHLRAYFHKVIENLAIDLFRLKGRQPRLVVLDEMAGEVEAAWQIEGDHAEALSAADDAALVREALSLLSPAERAALVMWEFEGRSTAEIAKELGVKESSVKHTLSRARANLRRILAERIIDEERGLTALDVLSISLRKSKQVAQKTSRFALSLVLVFFAFIGFSSLLPSMFSPDRPVGNVVESSLEDPGAVSSDRDQNQEISEVAEDVELANQNSSTKEALNSGPVFARSEAVNFLGLDSEGVPTGFTVASSDGSLGELFVGPAKTLTREDGIVTSNIVSTKSGSTNVLINQSVILDAFGTSYVAEVSVGINGGWQPLVLSYVSSDVERLASGNYLMTALMVVDSAVEATVKVSTGTSGTDLSVAPDFVSTRVLLDPTKTKILAQAVLVSADSQGDGA